MKAAVKVQSWATADRAMHQAVMLIIMVWHLDDVAMWLRLVAPSIITQARVQGRFASGTSCMPSQVMDTAVGLATHLQETPKTCQKQYRAAKRPFVSSRACMGALPERSEGVMHCHG
jgi:hypothetical protein